MWNKQKKRQKMESSYEAFLDRTLNRASSPGGVPSPASLPQDSVNDQFLEKNAAINKHNAKPPTDYRTSELLWMLNRDEKIATKLRKVIADSQAKRKKVEEHRSRMEKMVQSSCRDLYSWLAGHESTVCSVFESMLRRVRDGSGGHQLL